MRFWAKSFISRVLKISIFFYKSPVNLSYWWNFGFFALYFLISQLITGIILAMLYTASVDHVFATMYDLTSEVYYGWWVRNIHANGASFFFLVVYIHMARNIYYGSFVYPRQLLWLSGALIWVLMIATAFLGYILPWGQMSFWGAMVITSLLGALPVIGEEILIILWGSYSIDGVTLQRFYSLHYTLPFVILMLTIVHFVLLHEFGSNNPLGLLIVWDNIFFLPYYGVKDAFSIVLILIVFYIFVVWAPDKLGHSDNFILANGLVTPTHIVPEWYFLFLYAILRSVTHKLLGLVLIGASIVGVFLLPFICKGFTIRSTMFRPIYGCVVWVFFFICYMLGWIGGLPVMSPYFEIGQLMTLSYFIFLIVVFPLVGVGEKILHHVSCRRLKEEGDVLKKDQRIFKKSIIW